MTERNMELLEKTMQHIVDHPEKHYQPLVWADNCGTPGCFMGWAMHFDGLTYTQVMKAGQTGDFSVSDWAEKRLGLNYDEFTMIFSPNNTIEELQLMVKALVNGEELSYE